MGTPRYIEPIRYDKTRTVFAKRPVGGSVELLDEDIDDGDSAIFLDRVVIQQIRTKGSYLSGIDVEPNFNNGTIPFLVDGRVAYRQNLYERRRRAEREQRNRSIDKEWLEAEVSIVNARKFGSDDAILAAARSINEGKTVDGVAADHGILPAHSWVVSSAVSQLMVELLVPTDDDGTMLEYALSLPLRQLVNLGLLAA